MLLVVGALCAVLAQARVVDRRGRAALFILSCQDGQGGGVADKPGDEVRAWQWLRTRPADVVALRVLRRAVLVYATRSALPPGLPLTQCAHV